MNRIKIFVTFVGAALICLLLCLVTPSSTLLMFASGSQDGSVDPIRESLGKWVEVRKQISKERTDWLFSKDLLESRTTLTVSEIKAMKAKLSEMKNSLIEITSKTHKMEEQKQSLLDLTMGIASDLDRVGSAVAMVVPRLPRPLRDKVEPLANRLRGDHQAKTTGAKAQAIIGILNEVNKFNNTISTGVEVLDGGDGRMIEVSTLYLGIGHGYYLSSDLKSSGMGLPGVDSWEWKQDSSIRESISNVFSILRNESSAEYVLVPAIIR